MDGAALTGTASAAASAMLSICFEEKSEASIAFFLEQSPQRYQLMPQDTLGHCREADDSATASPMGSEQQVTPLPEAVTTSRTGSCAEHFGALVTISDRKLSTVFKPSPSTFCFA